MATLTFLIDIALCVGFWKAEMALWLKILFTVILFIVANVKMFTFKTSSDLRVFLPLSVLVMGATGFFLYYGLAHSFKLMLIASAVELGFLTIIMIFTIIDSFLQKRR